MRVDDLPLPSAARAEASSNPATRETGDGHDLLAWQREMERAQARDWFHEALPAHAVEAAARRTGGDSIPAGRPAEAGSTGRPRPAPSARMADEDRHVDAHEAPFAPPRSTSADAMRPRTAFGAADPRATTDASPEALTPPALGLTRAANVATPMTQQVVQAHHPSSRQMTGPAAEVERRIDPLPIRVHLEGDEAAVTVWLGVDAKAAGELAPLQQAIGRWLLAAGYGATTWICNGKPVPAPALHPSGDAGPADSTEFDPLTALPLLARLQPKEPSS